MTVYIDGLQTSDYVPNVIILFAGQYFSIRPPDSGLAIDAKYNGLVSRVTINPTVIDPLRATTVINSTSFSLIDSGQEVTKLFLSQEAFRVGEEVRVWLGRSFEDMAFSDYYELPRTIIRKMNKADGLYSFACVERKDRLDNGAFNIRSKLNVDILDITTTITLQYIPAGLPSAGYGRINDEFFSWTGISGNNLTGCVRGEFGSTPVGHDAGTDVLNIYDISATNGVNLILQMLVSPGGGGAYDVLNEGMAINESLIDVDQMEQVRDDFFILNQNLSFKLGGVENFQKFFEEEVLAPMGLRLRTNNNGKIGLAVIDRIIFEIDTPLIDETNTTKPPGFEVSEDRALNRLRIFYDWNYPQNKFDKVLELVDNDSISKIGAKAFKELKYEGVRNDGFAQEIGDLFLGRFGLPKPDIKVSTLNNASYLLVGDKVDLKSDKLPTIDGDLDFLTTLEVLRKSYNPVTGLVDYQLAFTSFSGLRLCIIAPSDTLTVITSQKIVEVSAGRGDLYRVGWKMVLYDNNASELVNPVQINTIQSINGDEITFQNNWNETLTPNNYQIKFAPYNEVIEQQKKFCFVSNDSNAEFVSDGTKPYQITY